MRMQTMTKLALMGFLGFCALLSGSATWMTVFAQAPTPAPTQTDPLTDHIFTPMMQLGFAMAFVMAMGFLWWLMRARRDDWNSWHQSDLGLMNKMTDVIVKNTEANVSHTSSTLELARRLAEFGAVLQELNKELLSRPCLLPQSHSVRRGEE